MSVVCVVELVGASAAYCDVVAHLPCYGVVVKEAQRYGAKWGNMWAQEYAIKLISSELAEVLTAHARTVCLQLYPTWTDFLPSFIKEGGIIEGTPPSDSMTPVTVDLLIEPTGSVRVLSTLDQVLTPHHRLHATFSVYHHELREGTNLVSIPDSFIHSTGCIASPARK